MFHSLYTYYLPCRRSLPVTRHSNNFCITMYEAHEGTHPKQSNRIIQLIFCLPVPRSNQEHLISKNINQCNKKNTANNRRYYYYYDYGIQYFWYHGIVSFSIKPVTKTLRNEHCSSKTLVSLLSLYTIWLWLPRVFCAIAGLFEVAW